MINHVLGSEEPSRSADGVTEPLASSAAMRIRTGSASSTSDLAGYLRRCMCIVAFVNDWTLDVGVQPGSLSAEHARLERGEQLGKIVLRIPA